MTGRVSIRARLPEALRAAARPTLCLRRHHARKLGARSRRSAAASPSSGAARIVCGAVDALTRWGNPWATAVAGSPSIGRLHPCLTGCSRWGPVFKVDASWTRDTLRCTPLCRRLRQLAQPNLWDVSTEKIRFRAARPHLVPLTTRAPLPRSSGEIETRVARGMVPPRNNHMYRDRVQPRRVAAGA